MLDSVEFIEARLNRRNRLDAEFEAHLEEEAMRSSGRALARRADNDMAVQDQRAVDNWLRSSRPSLQ